MSDLSSHIDIEGPPIGIEKSPTSRNERSRRPYACSSSEPSTHFDPGPPPMQRFNGQITGQINQRSAHRAGNTVDTNPFSWPRLPRRYPPLGGWTPGNEPFAAVRAAFVGDRRVALAGTSETIARAVKKPDPNPFNPLSVARLPRRVITDAPPRAESLQPGLSDNTPKPVANSSGSFYGQQYNQHRVKKTPSVQSVNVEAKKDESVQPGRSSSQTGTANLANLFNEEDGPPKSVSSSSYSGVFSRLSRAPSQAANEKVQNWTTQSRHAGVPVMDDQAGVKVLPTHDTSGNLLRHVLVSPGAVVSTDGIIKPGDTMMLHCVSQLQNDRVASLSSNASRRTYTPPPPGSSRKAPSSPKARSERNGSQKGFEPDETSDPTAKMPGSFQPDGASEKSGSHRSSPGSNRSKPESGFKPAASKLGSGSNRSRGCKQASQDAGGFTEDKGDAGSKKGSDKGGFKADGSARGGANAGTNWN